MGICQTCCQKQEEAKNQEENVAKIPSYQLMTNAKEAQISFQFEQEEIQKDLKEKSQVSHIQSKKKKLNKYEEELQSPDKSETKIQIASEFNIEVFEQETLKRKLILLQSNQLIKRIQNVKSENLMSQQNLWKFFDQFLDKMAEQEIQTLKQDKPTSITQFMVDYLIHQSGNDSLASKMLKEILLSLKNLQEQGNIYAKFYCRLLQVYNEDPIDQELTSYLIMAKLQFDQLLNHYIKSKRSTQQEMKANSQSLEQIQVGGLAPLVDAFKLVHISFETDPELGSNIIHRLLPDTPNRNDFILLVLLHKITYTDSDGSGDITQQKFCHKVEKLVKKYRKKDNWMCSKATFLTAIADEYEAKKKRDFKTLKESFIKFDKEGKGTIDYNDFQTLCKQIDNSLYSTVIQSFFKDAKQWMGQDTIDADAFAMAAQNYKLAKFGTGIFNAMLIIPKDVRQNQTPGTTTKPRSSITMQRKNQQASN